MPDYYGLGWTAGFWSPEKTTAAIVAELIATHGVLSDVDRATVLDGIGSGRQAWTAWAATADEQAALWNARNYAEIG